MPEINYSAYRGTFNKRIKKEYFEDAQNFNGLQKVKGTDEYFFDFTVNAEDGIYIFTRILNDYPNVKLDLGEIIFYMEPNEENEGEIGYETNYTGENGKLYPSYYYEMLYEGDFINFINTTK